MDRNRTFELTRRHLNAGKIETYERYGFDAVMGRREGIRFWDAYDDRSWINCHCNGGVFNLGHRNPAVLAAVQASFEDQDIGNLKKEGLEVAIPPFLNAANRVVDPPITKKEIDRC